VAEKFLEYTPLQERKRDTAILPSSTVVPDRYKTCLVLLRIPQVHVVNRTGLLQRGFDGDGSIFVSDGRRDAQTGAQDVVAGEMLAHSYFSGISVDSLLVFKVSKIRGGLVAVCARFWRLAYHKTPYVAI